MAIHPLIEIKTGDDLKQHALDKSIETALRNAGLDTLSKARHRSFVFDLSRTYWHDLGALLWLVAVLYKLKAQGNEVQLLLPDPSINDKCRKTWDFLLRWKFFPLLGTCVDDPRNLLPLEQHAFINMKSRYSVPHKMIDPEGVEVEIHTYYLLEMQTFFARQQLGDVFRGDQQTRLENLESHITAMALTYLCGWDLELARTFLHSVAREGVKNSLEHAQGTFVNISYRTDSKNLTLAICDNGVGIPSVLREAPEVMKQRKSASDAELIEYFAGADYVLDSKLIELSTEDGVTSDASRAGKGLYYLKQYVLKHSGELRIRSGTACVDFTVDGTKTLDSLMDSPGTLIRIQTPLKRTISD